MSDRPADRPRFTAVIVVLLSMLGACSKRESQQPEEPWLPDSAGFVRAEVVAGGIATRYTAHFEADKLERISEIRKDDGSSERTGEYVFNAARLIEYKGHALSSAARIELTFDMRGVLTASSGTVEQPDIIAIQNRAQLLRSLALARRSTQQHAG